MAKKESNKEEKEVKAEEKVAEKQSEEEFLEGEKITPDSKEEVEAISEAEIEEKEKEKVVLTTHFDREGWHPKTSLGKKVKNNEIINIDEILDNGLKILEAEIVDALLPDLESDLLMVGQSKGKFGGGQRRVFKQTQKKTMEGNKPNFCTYAIVGNNNGYIGLGFGKSKETVPAREKSLRQAKLNIIKILRGCGSWECNCGTPHTIPFAVEGKCSSVRIKLIPAPKGTGLCIEAECAKILIKAGIKDIWSRTQGHTGTKVNMIKATIDALKNLTRTRISHVQYEKLNFVEGKVEGKVKTEEPLTPIIEKGEQET